jgi:phosphohistidine phosphatase
MTTLYLLRHAKSSWDDPTLADKERPLAPRGRRDAKLLAEHLRRERIAPELVLCSPAVRTRQTLELVRPPGRIAFLDALYGASCDELLERLRSLPDTVASVMLIGHNPGLQELALELASGGSGLEQLEAKFPTAALATLSIVSGRWSSLASGDAILTGYVVPKQLR